MTVMDKVRSLAQLDRDAIDVYEQALQHVQDAEVRDRLTDFRDEHQHHVTELAAAVERLTGQGFIAREDVMGHVAEWVTAFRAMGGQRGALEAMRSAEKYHNSRYSEAVTWDVADDQLRDQLAQFYEDEKRHLAYVESELGVSAGTVTS
jgi:rubrerythrin